MSIEETKYVYVITNKNNGKKYVGSSIFPDKRFRSHILDLRQGKHLVRLLQDDFDTYGEDSFEMEVVGKISGRYSPDEEHQLMIELKTYDTQFGYNYQDPQMKPIVSSLEKCKPIDLPKPRRKKTKKTRRSPWFRSPEEDIAYRIARRLRSEGSVAKLAREADVAETTAGLWIRHPERMTQFIKVLALLRAAKVTDEEIARMIRG